MPPTSNFFALQRRETENTGKPTNPDGLVLEAWAQGYMVGSLIIMAAVAVANMRKGVILHKLILIEVHQDGMPLEQGTDAKIGSVTTRNLPWYLYFHTRASIWMVLELYRHLLEYVLELAQRNFCMSHSAQMYTAGFEVELWYTEL